MLLLFGLLLSGSIFNVLGFKRQPTRPFSLAVVEYKPVPFDRSILPEDYMSKNLDFFEQFVQQASSEAIDLIVFPEYGLTSGQINQLPFQEFEKFSILLPDKEDPPKCTGNVQIKDIYERIRCLAKVNEIYLLVNVLERVGDLNNSNVKFYNSAVAFDRNGVRVARYRKFNLYVEKYMSHPSTPDISFFDTDFGLRIGIFICFDINYSEPSRTLVDEFQIDILAFPTAWIDELPFLTALQYHSGWAQANGVLLLSSNYHEPNGGGIGSGIYGPVNVHNFTRNSVTGSNMVTSRFDSQPFQSSGFSDQDYGHYLSNDQIFYLYENLDGYTHQVLNKGQKSLELSQGDVRCKLDYQLEANSCEGAQTPTYIFMARSGERTFAGGHYVAGIQVCAVLACDVYDAELKQCAKIIQKNQSKTIFKNLIIEGTFLNGVLPMPIAINHQIQPLVNVEYKNTGEDQFRIESTSSVDSLYTLALYGRNYNLDL